MNVMFLRSAMSLDAGIAELVPVLQTAAREVGNAVAHSVADAARARPHADLRKAQARWHDDRSAPTARCFPRRRCRRAQALIAEAREAARTVSVGASPFLSTYGVGCEIDYKRRCTGDQRIMMHAQIGFRDLDKSRRAWAEIWEALDKAGHRVDRYGICLDWSMGYPAARRKDMPRGTGLIMKDLDDWRALTGMAPVAPHFGDFVIGTPAAFENTIAALSSGSTSVGNLGQYFAFRQPHWDDDIFTTANP